LYSDRHQEHTKLGNTFLQTKDFLIIRHLKTTHKL